MVYELKLIGKIDPSEGVELSSGSGSGVVCTNIDYAELVDMTYC